MKPLLCVREQANVPLGIIEGVLNEEKVEWRYADAWTGAALPELSEVSGLIVLGGTMNGVWHRGAVARKMSSDPEPITRFPLVGLSGCYSNPALGYIGSRVLRGLGTMAR